ncbi:MAG: MBL fold metallo-hydrolase [Daejeonella sp.]
MEPIKLAVTGSGDALGSGGRLNTCFYLETPYLNFLLGCGASVPPGLKKNNIATNSIDIIFITHFHGDHFGGLPFFLLEASVYAEKSP